MLALQRQSGVEFNPIPFRGDPPMMTALLAGDLNLAILALGNAAALQGRLPAIMVFNAQRLAELPDVPTATELGWPLVEAQNIGFFAPAGLSAPVLSRLEAECAQVLDDPRVREALNTARFARANLGSSAFAASLREDVEAKRALIAGAGMTPQ